MIIVIMKMHVTNLQKKKYSIHKLDRIMIDSHKIFKESN